MSRQAVDLAGKRFGKRVVLRREGSTTRGHACWRVRCDCGREDVATGSNLRTGKGRQCVDCAAYERRERALERRESYLADVVDDLLHEDDEESLW